MFILLENGQSAVTRRAAAQQIGEVQKLHPHELHNLLERIHQTYLQSSSWETRIAAGQTIEAILKNVPKWSPLATTKSRDPDSDEDNNNNCHGNDEVGTLLSFGAFDLEMILSDGARLMGSEGLEFDFSAEDSNQSGSREEALLRQQKLINARLDIAPGLTIDQIVTLDDIKVEDVKPDLGMASLKSVHDIFKQQTTNSAAGLSCREQNRARRKARQTTTTCSATSSSTGSVAIIPSGKSNGNCSNGGGSLLEKALTDEPAAKKIKIEPNLPENGKSSPTSSTTRKSACSVPDATGAWSEGTTSWPFQTFCSQLLADLFRPRWEVRHGAATGLRELFKLHLDGAGKHSNTTTAEMQADHQRFLEDVSLRLLSVLALDRFGDFVSDQVIAPVRETCAQVLGILLQKMPQENVTQLINAVLVMVNHKRDWEVRHGGLLVIKYLLVVREDLLQAVLPMVINPILAGLFDEVDDVSSVAASTLIPIATWLPKLLNAANVSNIVRTLWNLLLDQDELTSACNNFMGLLAAILGLPNAAQWIQMDPVEQLVPRLWPFLCHNSSSVRRSTLTALKTLTSSCTSSSSSSSSATNGASSVETNLSLFGVKDWSPQLLQEALRHIYQRILIEHLEDVQLIAESVWLQLISNADLSALLHAACPYVPTWLCLAMQPARLAFDPNYLIALKPPAAATVTRKRHDLGLEERQLVQQGQAQQKVYLGGAETIPLDVREKNVMRARYKACQMIGALSRYLVLPAPGVLYTPDVESPVDCYTKVLNGHLASRSALQRLVTGLVIAFWAKTDPSIHPGPPVIQERLKATLSENIYYEEVTGVLARLLEESRCFIATLKQYKVPVPDFGPSAVLSLEQINQLATWPTDTLKQQFHLRAKLVELIEERRRGLHNSFVAMTEELSAYNIYTQASLAGATICIHSLPEKLNPVVKPIMESLKREENEILQKLSADFLVCMMDQLRDRTPCPNGKIVTNLSKMLRGDVEFMPRLVWPEKKAVEYAKEELGPSNPVHGIITLCQQQKASLTSTRGSNAGTGRPVGRPPNNPEGSAAANDEVPQVDQVEAPQNKLNKLHRVGATFALTKICEYFAGDLPQKVPSFWEFVYCKWFSELTEELVQEMHSGGGGSLWTQEATDEILTALLIMETCLPFMSRSLDDQIFVLLPKLCHLLKHPLSLVRHMSSRCVATFAKVNPGRVMDVVMVQVVPSLAMLDNVTHRQGAIEAISCIVNRLQFEVVPYVVLLIVPVLGRMSDFDQSVRLMATNCFATLIQLMPLDGTTLQLPKMSAELCARKERDREFLEHLFAPKSIPDVKIPSEVKAELRNYQQAGVNWLWFLNKYKLHGILCDDMGLGKTLQAICLLAGDHKKRREEKEPEWPSLVICPPTLTGHWFYEVKKFVPDSFLKALHYVGFPLEREKLQTKVRSYNLVIASYEIVRKDIEFFRKVHWNYCVLDEGHIIKNGKTKGSKAIKLLVANHRLILSGTPIQNNVLELWSLFDFLMPGFLGTEKQFVTRYSRPIMASRDAKSSAKEQEAGTLALESLHRQVLPFLLRRIKEDVLVDLPPKITQDLLCELSPLQEKLYEDFFKKHFKNELQECFSNGKGTETDVHVFQALR